MATIRSTIRAQFPDCKLSVAEGTFDYLHHDDQSFERRSLPCLHVALSSKEYHLDRNDRRVYHDPDPSDVVSRLVAAGLRAVINVNAPGSVSVITSGDAPVNIAFGLGTNGYKALAARLAEMNDPFTTDIPADEARANVLAALDVALAQLAALGKTEQDAERLLKSGLGRSIRPAWFDAAWAVVSARRQLEEMAS